MSLKVARHVKGLSTAPLAAGVVSLLALVGVSPAVAQQPPQTDSMAPATSLPSYPDSAKGLEKLVKEMLQLEETGNQQELAAYPQSLELPDAEAWFKSVFGTELGAKLVTVTEKWRKSAPLTVPKTLSLMIAAKQTEVEAKRLANSCDYSTTEDEYPVVEARQRPEPLYDVRFENDQRQSIWAYFAYVNGAFRYIGSLQGTDMILPPVRSKEEAGDGKRIPIGGNVQQARALKRVPPEYPSEAKFAHIQGTVLLHAIIAKDGSIRQLSLLKGQCLLARASIEAVKQWQYQPTLLQGQPVEVDTTITVVFALSH